jgi:hypothetical protein
MPYALEVVLQAYRLSLHWNRRLSPGLVELALRPIADRVKLHIGRGLKSTGEVR